MIRIHRMALLLSLASAGVFTASAEATDSVKITPTHKAGQAAYIELDRHVDVTLSMPKSKESDSGDDEKNEQPPPMKIAIHQMYGVMRTNDSVTDDGAKYTVTFDRMYQEFKSPMGDAQFDTDNPEDDDASPPLGSLLKPFIGKPLKLEVDKDRQVASVKGMKTIANEVHEAGTGNPFLQVVENDLTDENAKLTWGDSFFVLYPNKEVKVGDKWTKALRTDSRRAGKLVISYECKFDHIASQDGHKVAIVTYETTTRNEKTDEDGPTLNGHGTGTAVFDIDRGEFIERKDKGHVSLKSTAQNAEQDVNTKSVVKSKASRDAEKAKLKKNPDKISKEKAEKKTDDAKKRAKHEEDDE